MESQAIEATAKAVKPTTTTPSAGWRCYHESDPRSKSQAQANARASAARAKTRKEKRDEGAEHINQIGVHWQDEFKRIARSKGVSEEKLKELNETHCKEGSQERLMHALKTLMVGDENTCTSVAQELADQVGLEGELFEEMATYAANNTLDFQSMAMANATEVASTAHAKESWRTDPHWEPAANITEQLNRTDGEGAETYKAAKAEVDHMRDTGGVLVKNRWNSEVQEDLKTAGPLDSKWVIVRKLKKCPKTSALVFSRLRLRLTLRGFRQRAGIQFDLHGTFAPVMHLGSHYYCY